MVIVKKFLVLIVLLLSIISVTAVVDQTDCLVYFQGEDCEGCEQANNHMNYLKARYTTLKVQEYEVYYTRENARLLEKYFESYNVPSSSRGLPALFMPGSYFVGSKSIIDLTEGRIQTNENDACPSLEGETAIGLVGERDPHDVLDTLTTSMITRGAIKDSLRPGMLALLLIFLMMLAALKRKENVIQRGIIFVIVFFITSILFGMGLFFKSPHWISKIIGIFVIIASLIRIKGFFGTWRIIFEEMPEKVEEKMKKFIRYLFTSVGFMTIGFIMTIFSTGKISEVLTLLRTLGLDGVLDFKLFTYVFYHTILITLIPVLLIFVIYKVIEKLDKHALNKAPHDEIKEGKWRDHTQKVLKFVVSSLMLLIGFILLFI